MKLPIKFSRDKTIQEIARVDYAGEYGAKRIYEGQIKYSLGKAILPTIQKMYNHELVHLKYFENYMIKNRIRPSMLMPLWHIGGYALGMLSSSNKYYTMLCTEAVENVIVEHYQTQIKQIDNYQNTQPSVVDLDMNNLKTNIENFCKDEESHMNHAIFDNSTNKQAYIFAKPARYLIDSICKIAIKISKVL